MHRVIRIATELSRHQCNKRLLRLQKSIFSIKEIGDEANRINYLPQNQHVPSGTNTFDLVRARLASPGLNAINLSIAHIPSQIMTNSRREAIDDGTENQ